MRQEIMAQLRMRTPVEIVRGFLRPNIHLAVENFPDEEGARLALVGRAVATKGTVLVYVTTRRQAEGTAAEL